jgi:hypothetical protein
MVTICYIDEYNISEQDFRRYSWLPKGKEDYLYNQQRSNPLHIIAAVTDEQLVSMLVLTHTIKAEDFQSFLPDVVSKMKDLLASDGGRFVLLYDNAAVHRAGCIKEEISRLKCLSILNCPYSPDLNFCEKFIRMHKQRLQHELRLLKYVPIPYLL